MSVGGLFGGPCEGEAMVGFNGGFSAPLSDNLATKAITYDTTVFGYYRVVTTLVQYDHGPV